MLQWSRRRPTGMLCEGRRLEQKKIIKYPSTVSSNLINFMIKDFQGVQYGLYTNQMEPCSTLSRL